MIELRDSVSRVEEQLSNSWEQLSLADLRRGRLFLPVIRNSKQGPCAWSSMQPRIL